MAVFRIQKATRTPPAIIESPGKIYIEGQAHDATTLAPIFNDVWPAHNSIFYQNSAVSGTNGNLAISMTGRHWFADSFSGQRNAALPHDYSMMTAGKDSTFVADLVLTENTLFIPADTGIMSNNRAAAGALCRIYDKSAGTFKTVSGEIGGFTGQVNGIVLQERDASTVITFNVSSGTSAGYNVTTVNPSTGVTSNLATGVSGGNIAAVVEETATDFWIFNQPIAASTGAASVYSMVTVSKSSNTVTVRAPTRPTVTLGSGPGYWPSAAIATSGTNRIVYTADSLNSSTGNLYNFATAVYDSANPTTPIVWTNVSPSGAGSMPGVSSNNFNVMHRTWAFTEGNDIYVCVAAYEPTQAGTFVALSGYYIHVYKATKAAPTTMVYVSSTFLGQTARPRIIFAVDENFSNLIVPYNTGTSFVTWNLGTQSYVVSSEASYIASSISVDQTGRIWIVEPNNSALTANSAIHILSPTVSSTITVNFQNASLSYAGTVINTNLLVSAYSFQGSRVANNITLQIDSNSATFDDDTQTKTVTTLSNGDLSVPIKITGAGYVRVLANLAI